MAGFDPNAYEIYGDCFKEKSSGLTKTNGVLDYLAILAALVSAVKGGNIKAKLIYEAEPRYQAGLDMFMQRGYCGGEDIQRVDDGNGNDYIISAIPDYQQSLINKTDLIEWLSSNNWNDGFFFHASITDSKTLDSSKSIQDCLSTTHPLHSQELSIAVETWNAVLLPNPPRPKQGSRKQLIEDYLRSNYTLNNSQIDRISAMLNPDRNGGAPSSD